MVEVAMKCYKVVGWGLASELGESVLLLQEP